MPQRIIRVFPRRTRATPRDPMAFVGDPPLFVPPADEIHISVAFTWDLPEAERLARAWAPYGPVQVGGPALGRRSADFVAGRYLAPGYTITSRGCPNHCWFCSVWRREGGVRELPIVAGWNVLDDNLLACSEPHIRGVFSMLAQQVHETALTGGLEAARFQPWHAQLLLHSGIRRFFFAYDTPDDLAPLKRAAEILWDTGFNARSHRAMCYVLIGFVGDDFEKASTRMYQVLRLGLIPMAMLYRAADGKTTLDWRRFQREWARPVLIGRQARRDALWPPLAISPPPSPPPAEVRNA